MTTSQRITGFATILVAALVGAFAVGKTVGPIDDGDTTSDHSSGHGDGADPVSAPAPGGLQVAVDGYRIHRTSEIIPPGVRTIRFSIIGPDERPVTAFATTHDKKLHLIAVRRDTGRFQHVHPTMNADGVWSARITLTPGTWRIFADFRPTGRSTSLTLGTDLSVPGGHTPHPTPTPSRVAHVGTDTVTLTGDLIPGRESTLTARVTSNGSAVTDLEPYLAAYGHLVALRVGDLAYLHVHPEGTPGDGTTAPGPDIVFATTAPSVGRYRLFLDYRRNGVVRTAEFTLDAVAPEGSTVPAPDPGATTPTPASAGHTHG